ncbi:histone-lysine N-methyltransferase PRDM9-like isoform X2 [Amblyomma americanum]
MQPVADAMELRSSRRRPSPQSRTRAGLRDCGITATGNGAIGADGKRFPKRVVKQASCAEDEDHSGQGASGYPSFSTREHTGESRYPRRKRKRGMSSDCEGNSDEQYLFCDDCGSDHPGDCPVHGPLTHIQDTEVEAGDPLRANKSLPKGLSIRRCGLKRNEIGVFTLKPLPRRVFFGPYEGLRVKDNGESNAYTWQVRKNGKEFLVDGRPLDSSNWMRYVKSAASPREPNLVAYTRQGNIYYRTCKAVGTGEELLVSCGPSCARERGLLAKPRASRPPGDEGQNTKSAIVSTFPCETCGDLFSAQELLEKHRPSDHSQKPEGRTNVTRHQRNHTGERPFVCKECGKAFVLRQHLTYHLLIHSKKKPHECTDCGQRFRDAFHMARHRKVHHSSGGRLASLVCRFCGNGFFEMCVLKRHILTHTGEKPYACSHCGRRFATRGNTTRHERIVHSRQYALHCPHCGQGLADMTNLRIHVRRRHSSAEKEEPQYSED